MDITHVHAHDPNESFFGRAIRPGEKVELGDVFDDAMSRKWKPVGSDQVGYVVPKNTSRHSPRTFVRPPKKQAVESQPEPEGQSGEQQPIRKASWFAGL